MQVEKRRRTFLGLLCLKALKIWLLWTLGIISWSRRNRKEPKQIYLEFQKVIEMSWEQTKPSAATKNSKTWEKCSTTEQILTTLEMPACTKTSRRLSDHPYNFLINLKDHLINEKQQNRDKKPCSTLIQKNLAMKKWTLLKTVNFKINYKKVQLLKAEILKHKIKACLSKCHS